MGESAWHYPQASMCPSLNMSEVMPQFGCVQDVFVVDGEVHFRVQLQDTFYHAEHYHAYVIMCTEQFSLVPSSCQYCSHTPLYHRQVQGLTRSRRMLLF